MFPTQLKNCVGNIRDHSIHVHHSITKKPALDPSDGKLYRPISNLTVLSKVLERLVARQLIRHLSDWKLLPELQSAYRDYHSTKTTILRVVSDILEALDRGDLAALSLLRCSTYLHATFDSVDHIVLLRRLQSLYGIRSTVLDWFTSYLEQRVQYVRFLRSHLHPFNVTMRGAARFGLWTSPAEPKFFCVEIP